MMNPRQRRLAPIVALFVAVAMAAAGCTGGRSATNDAAPSEPTGTDAVASSVPQFGDLESPCGPGTPSGAPDQAVDGSTITIGYGDDAGYTGLPGQGHEASDAIKALIGWCNQQGGINGRQVKGDYYDAKITEANNVMADACTQVFMMVGQFFALASGAEQTRIECGLPTVPGLISSAELANAPLMVSPSPNPVQYSPAMGAKLVADAYPSEVSRAGVMMPDFATSIETTQKVMRAATAAGWTFADCTQTFPITGVSDFRPYLQRLKDCDVGAVYTNTTGEQFQNMLDAAAQLDFHPVWFDGPAVYTTALAAWNVTGNGDKVYFPTWFQPLDHTPEGSANATYVQLVKSNGGDVSYGGQVATSAFLLWATGAKACGNDLTRNCVMNNLRNVHTWTAGGLSAPTDPGANQISACQLVMHLDGPKWAQWQPEENGDYFCDPSLIIRMDPPIDAEAGLLLDPNGVSQKYLR
jgi:ABC-type branched-subunit amino acid transport system substrate-binding protein